MKKETIKTFALTVLAVLCAVCCQQSGTECPDEGGQYRLRLEARTEDGGETTRASSIVESATLPQAFTIHVTAWQKPDDGTAGSTYFSDAPFKLNTENSTWESETFKYWPVGSMLEFLCVATDDSILDLTELDAFKWNAAKSTSSVSIEIPNIQKRQTEILYASAFPENKSDNVGMTFKHSQSLLDFEFESVDDQLVRLDTLIIENVYMQGRLKINNPGGGAEPTASWNYSYTYPVTAYVPGIKDCIVRSATTTERKLVIPAQNVGTVRISYTVRPDTSVEWSKGYSYTKELDLSVSEWEQSKKYTCRVRFKHTECTIDAASSDITVEVLTDRWTKNLIFEL